MEPGNTLEPRHVHGRQDSGTGTVRWLRAPAPLLVDRAGERTFATADPDSDLPRDDLHRLVLARVDMQGDTATTIECDASTTQLTAGLVSALEKCHVLTSQRI